MSFLPRRALAISILLAPLAGAQAESPSAAAPGVRPDVQVGITPANLSDSTPIPDAFAGLDLPLADVTTVIGNSSGLNPLFANLLKNLTMYATKGHMRIRVGNDTLAWSGPHSPQKDRIPALAHLTRQFHVSYLLGVDFKSNDLEKTASDTSALANPVSGIPADSIEALELGNEADLYPASSQPDGKWNDSLFAARFARYARAVGKLAAPVWAGTRGPFFGGANPLERFVADNAASIGLVDMHQYYGSNCHSATLAPGDLLKPVAAVKAQMAFQPAIAAAHARRLPFVLSEWNSASCGGIAGVSDTFESALWTLDGLFEWLKVGLDGVTLTTGNKLPYSPWQVGTAAGGASVGVAPNYYGMRMFLQATQRSAKRVNLTLANGNKRNVKVWATIDDRDIVRVVVINKDAGFAGPVEVSLGGYAAPASYVLTAPGTGCQGGPALRGTDIRQHARRQPGRHAQRAGAGAFRAGAL